MITSHSAALYLLGPSGNRSSSPAAFLLQEWPPRRREWVLLRLLQYKVLRVSTRPSWSCVSPAGSCFFITGVQFCSAHSAVRDHRSSRLFYTRRQSSATWSDWRSSWVVGRFFWVPYCELEPCASSWSCSVQFSLSIYRMALM